MTNAKDVDRHFLELEKQIESDDIGDDSNVSKTLNKLRMVLKKDGFLSSDTGVPGETVIGAGKATTVTKAMKSAHKTPTRSISAKATEDYVVRAFRVVNASDANVVSTVFTGIDGWKTQTISSKGLVFMVVTNAPRWSKKRIKVALKDIVGTKKAESKSDNP